MRIFKNILAIIIVLALCAGVLIYALNDKGGATNPEGSGSVVSSGTVVINEFMASNGGCLPDDKGECSDWIELYNPSDQPVNLSGMGLSDDKQSLKWAFPGITLPAGGYLVVFASGNSETNPNAVLHTNFKLNAAQGGIYLADSGGKIIDEVEYKDQTSNISTGRKADDLSAWTVFEQPSPGFSNDEAGAQAFMQSRYAGAEASSLQITEVMASNQTTLTDNTGEYSDYIEIYNSGAEAVSLLGYGLSDDPQKVLDWRFPDISIAPGQYIVVFASGKGSMATDLEKGAIHTNFGISSYQETIVLSTPTGLIIDQVAVNESQADMAYARTPDDNGAYADAWAQTSQPSPGFVNTQAGYEEFMAANPIALGPVIISEVMASNSQYLVEDDGNYYDWIELYNQGTEAVNLAGYGLTDNSGNPAKWRLPDTVLAPGQYLTVMASGLADSNVKKNYIHTNFSLSAQGEILALFNAEGVLQDKYNLERTPYGVSVGRMPQQTTLSYFTQPTPGAANSSPCSGIAATPAANISAGRYDAAQQITLTSGTQDAAIYYTTDGSVPTQNSTPYTGPITINKTGMIRARAFKNGYLDSGTFTATYIIGANHSLPVISLVTDHGNLFDPTTGIYVLGPNAQLIEGHTEHYQVANYLIEGRESERPASFEVFDESGKPVFSQDVAIRIQGGFSRDNQQKSFAIIARNEYGSGSMAYPFFEELPFTEYKSLVLRNGGQDQLYAKIKEAVVLSMMGGKTNCLTQAYKTYVVYLNGEYWGVYFLEEKRNEHFVAQHENFDNPDSINILSGSGLNYVINGTNEGYKELYNYVTSHDMSAKENFNYVAERLDTDSFMDLMVNQIYVANSDYYNLQFYQLPGGKWKQIFYDMCWSFREPTHETLAIRRDPNTGGSTMFNALLSYGPWREAFIKRFAQTMEELYQTERFVSVIDEVAASVAPEIPAERAKFTDIKSSNWEAQVEKMRTFAKERPANVLKQLKSVFGISGSTLRSYFTLSDEQLKTAFNLSDEQMQSIFG